ncbi:MAG: hypothetical protein ACXVB9_08065 [Bdellovibrionota bacterium]
MKTLSEFGCVVGILNGRLHRCPIVDGWPEFVAGKVNWIAVKPPADQRFLDAANSALKTNFRANDLTNHQINASVDTPQAKKIATLTDLVTPQPIA